MLAGVLDVLLEGELEGVLEDGLVSTSMTWTTLAARSIASLWAMARSMVW